ncbi:MAG: Hsp33 family molecular chaperone HslO [Firmicutes bacterium]|nr:Hsp33 family molecular chaperone HslO [Bacillota bacterium]
MKTRDYLLKIMDRGKNIRLYLARTTSLVEEAHRRHGTSAPASAALGRVMTAALMMASDLKGDADILTLRIEGNGPAGVVLATADSHGGVRGLITNPFADVPSITPGKLAVGELVGTDGYLEVIKDLGMKQPFAGRVPLVSGEIAEDVAHYYLVSEQIPSLISLGVLVNPDLSVQAAGGLFVQALPEASAETLETIEKNIFNLGSLSSLLNVYERLEDILPLIMRGLEYAVLGEQELAFRCNCNRERLGGILAGLAPEELADNVSPDDIEVECNFCREKYLYTPQEIEAWKKSKP